MHLNRQSSSWQKIGLILPVSAGNYGRIGALGVGQREQPLGFVDGRPAGPLGQGIGRQVRRVWPADALHPDLRSPVPALKGIRDSRARASPLF